MSPLKSLKSFLSVPLLWRELSQLAARKRTYVFRILYGAIVLSVAWIVFREIIDLGENPGFEVMGRGAELFKAIIVCQYSVVYVFLPAYCAGLISGEKERDTLQVMFTTKLSPWSIIIEKMLSRLIPFALLIVISVPILAVAYNYGGISAGMIWQSSLLLMLATFQIAAIAVLCSTYFQRTVSSFVATYVVSGLFLYVLPIAYPQLIESTATALEAPSVRNVPAGVWCAPWVHQKAVLVQPMPLAYIGVMSAAILGSALVALCMARLWLIPRAVKKPRSLLRFAFSGIDTSIETMGVRLKDSKGPDRDPIAWRETTRGVIGNTRYQLYVLGFATVAIGWLAWLAHQEDMRSTLATIQTVAFIVGTLIMVAKGTSLFSGERSGQTLDVLLTTPVTNRDLMLQKYRGLRNLIAVLLVIYLQLTCLYAWHMEVHDQPPRRLPINGVFAVEELSFDPYLFVACQIGVLIIYPQMIAWLSVILGLTFRRSLVALTMTLISLIAWCVLPVVGLLLYDAFVESPDNASLILVSCPVFVPTLNLANSWGTRPGWTLAITNAVVYSVAWFFLRSHALTLVERKLHRRDESSWIVAPADRKTGRESKHETGPAMTPATPRNAAGMDT